MNTIKLRQLDDRMAHLYLLDKAIQLGRIQGQTYQLLQSNYERGIGPKPKFERTSEYRLLRHLEREYRRVYRVQCRG